MNRDTTGYSRDCYLVGKYAIKTPTTRNGLRAFLMGWLGNIREWDLSRVNPQPRLCRVQRSFFWGLVNVCKRYKVLDRALTEEEFKDLPIYNADRKRGNYALDDDGVTIIVLDYGHCDAWLK